VLTGETMREMSKADRVIGVRSPTNNDAQKTSLALKEDFKKLQQINNQMMATVWAHDQVDCDSVYKMLSSINSIAVRLRNRLTLPQISKSELSKISDPQTGDAGTRGIGDLSAGTRNFVDP
jgi:hypothetical protein